MTGFDGAEAAPAKAQLVAVTVNVCVVFRPRPLIAADVAPPPTTVTTPVCGLGAMLYDVTAHPPVLAGGVQVTVAVPWCPAVAVTPARFRR